MKLYISIVVLCFVALSHAQRENGRDYHDMMDGWNRTEYPNPFIDPLRCGREKKTFICDPDRRLDKYGADQLDAMIESLVNETSCPCSLHQCKRERLGYRLAVAIVYKMRPDDKDLRSKKHGDDDNTVDLDKKLHMGELFAYTLQNRWNFGRCEEGIVIFYSVMDNILYTNVDSVARKKLPDHIVGEISLGARHYFTGDKSNIHEGLQDLVRQYRAVLDNSYKALPAPKPRAARMISNGAAAVNQWAMTAVLSSVLTLLANKW